MGGCLKQPEREGIFSGFPDGIDREDCVDDLFLPSSNGDQSWETEICDRV
jgi:hypothetical protein